MDYGRRSMVNRNMLQPMHVSHEKLPEQAITCQLAGIETDGWTTEAMSSFEGLFCSGLR